MKRTKVLVVGIGGVGGYFGGLLAHQHHRSTTVDICFLARGSNLLEIQKSGLTVIDDASTLTAVPRMASDRPEDFGVVDYVILCTKTYDLDNTIDQLKPIIAEGTVIVPLQNGVDNKEKIRKTFPKNLITDGCVYLVSRLERPGKVVKKGSMASLFFGINDVEHSKLDTLHKIILEAGIRSTLSKEIQKIIWEKFVFLSSIATATAYFDAKIHNILNDNKRYQSLLKLVAEVNSLAKAKKISISENLSGYVIEKLRSLPKEATSSMHSDFQHKKSKTELESLTGFVVTEGYRSNVTVTTFSDMYNHLKNL